MAIRIDKWLWAARFFKTRSLAQQAIEGGKVRLNGERIKPAREVRCGDRLEITTGDSCWDVAVIQLSDRRGPAPQARLLYAEDESSLARRLAVVQARRLAVEPAGDLQGRPTKRDRRSLEKLRGF